MTDPRISPALLVARTEERRVAAFSVLDTERRGKLRQFFTPAPVACLLASMFDPPTGSSRILDAGAGVGSLTAALVAQAAKDRWSGRLEIDAVEIDPALRDPLGATLEDCECTLGVDATTEHRECDFIEWACDQLQLNFFESMADSYDVAILNPPYRKLATRSRERLRLLNVGIEVTNLYAAFVALAARLLAPGGQLVAITPRSFCNGPYFRAFRRNLLAETSLRRIHVFESRDLAFRDSAVLQENVILSTVKGGDRSAVTISTSWGGAEGICARVVPYDEVVHRHDLQQFIHVVPSHNGTDLSRRFEKLPAALPDLDTSVSTGRVVGFRAREHLRAHPCGGTVPLVCPSHLTLGRVRWPNPTDRKPNALALESSTEGLCLPIGHYVLVRRLSSKEEPRRLVAAVSLAPVTSPRRS
ncbi:MAG: Eco57I restriction-modification methylase domain-containing protein [Actinomycetota bacterium]